MAKLTERKYSYTVGQWNVNTVAMGGLGKDPDLTAEVEQTGQYAHQWCDIRTYAYGYVLSLSGTCSCMLSCRPV